MEKHPFLIFWRRKPLPGLYEGMSFNDRKKVFITHGAAMALTTLGPVFVVINLIQGYTGLAAINLGTMSLGVLSLFLNRRMPGLAALVMAALVPFAFLFSSLLYRNGMEYTLLLGMMGAIFMFDRFSTRILVAVLNGIGFLFARIYQYGLPQEEMMPVVRYGINLLVFLACYLWILEIFHVVNARHRRDVEEKNRALEKTTRELQEANLAKERLFSIVAHDLRGPVGNLQVTLELLAGQQLDAGAFQSLLDRLREETNSAYECLDTVLAWSASQLGTIRSAPKTLRLRETVARCVGLFENVAARKPVALENGVPPEARVSADEDQLLSILRNLLSNAVKFTPAGGRISLRAARKGDFWKISVADTGVGMSEGKVRSLFEAVPMTSTPGTNQEKGVGLGLQICRDFVRQQGGVFTVESRLGEGSTFSFTLPAA